MLQCNNIVGSRQGKHPGIRSTGFFSCNLFMEIIMYVTPEQIAATNKAGVEAILGFANSQFAAFEPLSALNFNATKSAFEESVDHAKSLLGAKDIQEFVNLNTAVAQPTLEKAIAYSRSVYE